MIKCVDCGKGVTARSKTVQCALCDGKIHIACCNIEKDFYGFIERCTSPALSFLCAPCRPLLNEARMKAGLPPMTPPTTTKEKEPRTPDTSPLRFGPSPSTSHVDTPYVQQALFTPTGNTILKQPEIEEVNKTFADVVAAGVPSTWKVQQPKIPNVKNVKSKGSTSNAQLQAVMDKVSQLEQRLQISERQAPSPTERIRALPPRDRCLIIVNVPESEEKGSAERMLHDQTFLQGMVSRMFDEGEAGVTVVSAYRLGRRFEDSSKTRPLKVVLGDPEESQRVFRRTFRLKGERYYVLRDLSPEDRVKMKAAVEDLRTRRSNGETDLRIVDFLVVKKTPRISWRPILLLPLA